MQERRGKSFNYSPLRMGVCSSAAPSATAMTHAAQWCELLQGATSCPMPSCIARMHMADGKGNRLVSSIEIVHVQLQRRRFTQSEEYFWSNQLPALTQGAHRTVRGGDEWTRGRRISHRLRVAWTGGRSCRCRGRFTGFCGLWLWWRPPKIISLDAVSESSLSLVLLYPSSGHVFIGPP